MTVSSIQQQRHHFPTHHAKQAGEAPRGLVKTDGDAGEQQALVDEITQALSTGEQDNRSLAVLRFKSDLQIRQSEDGTTQLSYKSKLKFNYEFQSEDGTTIKLSAKVKTQISYEESSDGSFELKTRIKIHIEAVKKSVGSELSPLLPSSDAATESPLTDALESFRQLLDQADQQFADDTLNGDDLIAKLVNAFNELSQTVQAHAAFGEPTGAEPPHDVVDGEVLPPPVVAAPEIPSSTGDEPAAEVAEETVVPANELTSGEEAAGVPATSDDLAAEAVDDQPGTGRKILINLRIKFSQSLSSLVSDLDRGEATEAPSSRFAFRERTRFDLRLTAYGQNAPDAQLPGRHVDVGG